MELKSQWRPQRSGMSVAGMSRLCHCPKELIKSKISGRREAVCPNNHTNICEHILCQYVRSFALIYAENVRKFSNVSLQYNHISVSSLIDKSFWVTRKLNGKRKWEKVSDNHCTTRASTSDRISWLQLSKKSFRGRGSTCCFKEFVSVEDFGVTQSFYHFLQGGLLFFWEITLWIHRDSFYNICYLAPTPLQK